jgi:hypothetical membrane protein
LIVYVRCRIERLINLSVLAAKKNLNENTKENTDMILFINSKTLARAAIIFGIAFLALLALLHFLKPEFHPSWHLISEYEIGEYGYLMVIAFFCWGAGFLALTLSLWHQLPSVGGTIGKWWLLIISIALFGAGIFTTNPITEEVRSTTDRLHALSGAMMIFTLPIASLLISRSLTKSRGFASQKAQIIWLEVFVWVGLLAFFGALVIYKPQGRQYNETVLIGWPNRFMVFTYTLWLIGIARITSQQNVKDVEP